ncbi:DnaJ-like protein DjlA [hydrothermal vent metagenome]|uniref:DnaJ-like protein DjlA n=1 Tax=hydrothermal vent metagenome TaxID=652676 RepID=A0A1W1D283_9ZZZZ
MNLKKIIGLSIIAFGIFVEISWLGFCFGSIIIGLLLLFFVPRVLFFPFTFFIIIGLTVMSERGFSRESFQTRYRYRTNHNNYSFSSLNDLDMYYDILESQKTDSMEVIKKNYRRLIKKYHYDTLVSQNLSEEELKQAKQKTQEINEAYDAIKKSRKE